MSLEIQTQLEAIISGLTDFQRATVDAVLARYDTGEGQRVLIADEVGLGKTIIAKGVIAKLIAQSLERKSGILKVAYICSNQAIAQENRRKLAVFHDEQAVKYMRVPSFSRLAELGVQPEVDGSDDKILEICSLTPATSFNLTLGHGNKRERYIIYRALVAHPNLACLDGRLSELFRADVSTWAYEEDWFNNQRGLVASVLEDFVVKLSEAVSLSADDCNFMALENPTWIDLLVFLFNGENTEEDEKKSIALFHRIRCQLRQLFVRCCARNLSADLFILDEFQRFKELLDIHDESEQGLITKEVFQKQDVSKVLLLSATPFKAVTRVEEDEGPNAHLQQLQHLLRFLANGNSAQLDRYEEEREALLTQILRLRDTSVTVDHLDDRPKIKVEATLRPLICRTERSQISHDFDAVTTTNHLSCNDTFSSGDIESFVAMDKISQQIESLQKRSHGNQLIEFYKAAPWPLSFLSGYQFRDYLEKYWSDTRVKEALKSSRAAWLPIEQIENYQLDLERDAPNAKVRTLVKTVFGDKGEKLLWVPPSLPYYPLEGVFKGQHLFSKTLLFSAFVLAPRALSALLSYEAERRLISSQRNSKAKYFNDTKTSPIIRFDGKSSLASWALIYPALSLMEMSIVPGKTPLSELLKQRQESFTSQLIELQTYEDNNTRKSDNWYAMAPFLLDRQNGHHQWMEEWFEHHFILLQDNRKHSGRLNRLQALDRLLRDEKLKLGPMPKDLASFLALLSLAGPGVCMARTWQRLWGQKQPFLTQMATQGGLAVSLFFNKPEAQKVLRTIDSRPVKRKKRRARKKQPPKHWLSVLRYCADGNLQALLDEYGHQLKDTGLGARDALGRLEEVLGVQTSNITAQYYSKGQKKEGPQDALFRCHYAVALGNQKTSDDKGLVRVGHVRNAFNSPFRPFVLSSTSIGQEGLDFHWYCSRVVHWNLPSNPIDLEQREGRVNRYKSLIVRRRVAEIYGHMLRGEPVEDPWKDLFVLADIATRQTRKSDLIPYWYMPGGSAQLERFVPMLPMSRETERLDEILRILSLYRLTFGQPRQQELLENLLHRDMSIEEINMIKKKLVIDLAPINYL